MVRENRSSDNEDIKEFEFERINHQGEGKGSEFVAVEKSHDLIVNGVRLASVMITPSELEEFAYGYLVSEAIVESKDRVLSIKIRGNELHTFIEGGGRLERWLELRSSGCVGVNWEKSEDEVKVGSEFRVKPDLVFQILHHLDTIPYRKTSGVHSATLTDEEGKAIAKSVDVGRHNTFDKVIGKALVRDTDLTRTILLASGRQSAGTVMKAARVGVPIIVSKAAPLSSGIRAAKKTNLTLICFASENKFSIFSGGQRIERQEDE